MSLRGLGLGHPWIVIANANAVVEKRMKVSGGCCGS